MENKLTRFFKIVMAIFAVLLLGITLGLVTTVGASDVEDFVIIETNNNTVYNFYPNGYEIGQNAERVEFTGTYVLTGEANTNVTFASDNGESVTYNVIILDWYAYAKSWSSLLHVNDGVTLNLTAHGVNRIIGYNHAGISGNVKSSEITSTVNITVMENSNLEIGYQDSNAEKCIHESVGITLNSEATSSVDMSVDDWRNNGYVTFSVGEAVEHATEYSSVDDSKCALFCSACGVEVAYLKHEAQSTALDGSDENAATKHSVACIKCNQDLGNADHSFANRYKDEKTHQAFCEDCGFEADAIEHNTGETGCIDCGKAYSASVDADGKETNYFEFRNAVVAVDSSGGVLKLLGDMIVAERITATGGDVTIDLNGFLLERAGLSLNNSSLKITVIDSSAEKTGVFNNISGGASACFNGTVEYNGITIHSEAISVDKGLVIFNNVKVERSTLGIFVQSGKARVELTDVRALNGLEIQFHLYEPYDDCVEISGGEYLWIKIPSFVGVFPYGEEVTVADMLSEGYALKDENGIVYGFVKEVQRVTLVEHSEHIFEKYFDYGGEHLVICVCGASEEGAEREAHTVNQDGLCAECGVELVAQVLGGDSEKCFSSVMSAFDYANSLESASVKILRDATVTATVIYSDTTLDLNGYTLTCDSRIYINGKLTVCDSSQAQTGRLAASGDLSYVFEISNGGALVVNSGEIFGLIFTALDQDDQSASIEINGGKFTGTEKFRLKPGSSLVINGGCFENENGTILYWMDSGVSVTINGGVFIGCSLIAEYSAVKPSLEDILGTNGDCQLVFVDEKGNEIVLDDLTALVEGKMTVVHKGSAAFSSEEGHAFYCESCDMFIGFSEHSLFVYSENESDMALHAVSCGICDYVIRTEEHMGGEANCTSLAECELCGSRYGSVDASNHAGGEASCTEQAICERCEEPYGELNPQNHSSTEIKYAQSQENADEHNVLFACCEAIKETGKHEDGLTTCENKAKCSVCSLTYGSEPTGHSYSSKCDADCDTCGDSRTVEGHVYDNACDKTCNECGAERKADHTYATDGKCVACGASKAGGTQNESPEEDEGLGTGAVVGITVGSVAVFGGGAFALIWFVLRKKYLVK